ncbi:MAG: hypothetical protein V8S87_00435 [Oscillospiraceae bacterium]
MKMFSQATRTLRMLMSFTFNKRAFLDGEYRDKVISAYTAQPVFEWRADNEKSFISSCLWAGAALPFLQGWILHAEAAHRA